MDFTTTIKLHIYKTIVQTASAPAVEEVANDLGAEVEEVAASFQEIAGQRLMLLEPTDPHKIRMAPPFSGIETFHKVNILGKSYFANCAWDSLGIAAAMKKDADIESLCEDCGEKLTLQVRNGRPVNKSYAVHFAVPVAKWLEDLIYT